MKFIFYRGFNQDDLLEKVYRLKEQEEEGLYQEVLGDILAESYQLGLGGDLFKKLICYKIVADENVLSLSAENEGGQIDQNLKELALQDIEQLKVLFHLNVVEMRLKEKEDVFKEVYEAFEKQESAEKILDTLLNFYHTYGAGMMNQYRAFKWHTQKGLVGIKQCDLVRLEDLVGCDYQKQALIKNTESFLEGKEANNTLLFGDRGTGKSSSVKALLNAYYDKGLRLVELSKADFKDFNNILKSLRGRGLKYILFLDDLSFEEFEVEYKYMKALIEGGVEVKPKNVLIYATSNRRHLIREIWEERKGEDVHVSDTKQEKLSLSDRFGLALTFTSPNQNTYLEMVYKIANQYQIQIDENTLREKALQWELVHGGRSGRTAKQFVQSLL